MSIRRIVCALCTVVLLGGLAGSATGATSDGRRTTYFTFDHAIQLPGVTLPAGSYAFEVANPYTSSNIVRVASRDRKKVFVMRITRFVHRPVTGNLKATISLGESPAGSPQPIRAWYPQGETLGREFIY